MTPVIEVTGLTKRYGGEAVVDGISFHVERGEIFGILGPNGAGKTTAVECLEGLRRRDAGQVRILGLDPKTDGHRLHQRIGVQLQETQLQDKIKVREALELYASFYPDPADWRELLDRWGLAGKRHTRFGKLSGGQKQRLFIALALVGNPEVVFLDELTAGLDPGARRATWDLIAQVRDSGVTVVLVSHFMDEVEELCDRVAILERGRIAALDTPAGWWTPPEAREIHDTLAQGLTGIITQLEAAQQTASEPERERRIDNAKRLARDSLAEARRSVQALRPQALEDSKLPDALADAVTRWTATSGVLAEVRTTGDPQALHPEVEVTLLRVAQEALANVAKHAGAAHAWVTLSYMEDVVTLDVRDDGSGFDRAEPSPDGGGFGLIAMRQRVNRLAGQLEIESEPGVGTAVSASLPAIPLGPPPQAAKTAPPPQAARTAEPPQAATAKESS